MTVKHISKIIREASGHDVIVREDGSRRVCLSCSNDSVLTEQSHLPYTHLSYVINKYISTKNQIAIPQTEFKNLTGVVDYHTALNTVLNIDNLFAKLPSKVRLNFDHDPALLVKALNDPSQHDLLRDLGVLEKKESSPVGAQPDAVTPTSNAVKTDPKGQAPEPKAQPSDAVT